MSRPPVRMGQFSVMRFTERLVFAVVQATITGAILGWFMRR